jgi:ribokinase
MVIGVEDIPVTGETVTGKSVEYQAGGKGGNQACACSMLGGDTTFLSVVGNDDFGGMLRNSMERAGVKTAHINVCDRHTGTAVIYVNKSGNNCIVVVPGANALCDVSLIEENIALIEECTTMLVQLEVNLEGVYWAIERAAALKKRIILNPAPMPDAIPDRIFPLLDYITPNETELMKLTGILTDSPEAVEMAARSILKKGVKNVLVTMGGQGAMLLNSEGATRYAPPDVTVVDTTAAGDTFNGAIAVALEKGLSIGDAINFANLAGTVTVSRRGAQDSIPSLREVGEFAVSRGLRCPIQYISRQ